jgi:hypothetical protein
MPPAVRPGCIGGEHITGRDESTYPWLRQELLLCAVPPAEPGHCPRESD